MITENKRIELNKKVVFETLVANAPDTFSYRLNNEAFFIHVEFGSHVAMTPSEVIEVPVGNLAFFVGQNIILKVFPNEEGVYKATIIHIARESVLESLTDNFPEVNTDTDVEVSRDIITGKPCVVTQNYIEGILQYFNNRHIITDDLVQLKVKEILFLLLRSKKAGQVAQLLEGFVSRTATSFKNTVESHLFNDISLDELAHLCNMSLSTFKRHFKKIYGDTPSEYILNRRLEESTKLLVVSDRSIIDIALDSGFKSMSHYSRRFKEKYGIPPSQYKLTFSGK